MKVYVVFGSTGEYSDRREWIVCGFLDEKRAQERVVLASHRANELFVKYKNTYWDATKEKNEYDDRFDMDYTGTTYYYAEVDCE